MKYVIFALLAMGLVGCVTTPSQFNKLHIGDTHEQVESKLGDPVGKTVKNGMEFYEYLVQIDQWRGTKEPYIVIFGADGKVKEFGPGRHFYDKPEITIRNK